jgi:hypothetical protein
MEKFWVQASDERGWKQGHTTGKFTQSTFSWGLVSLVVIQALSPEASEIYAEYLQVAKIQEKISRKSVSFTNSVF